MKHTRRRISLTLMLLLLMTCAAAAAETMTEGDSAAVPFAFFVSPNWDLAFHEVNAQEELNNAELYLLRETADIKEFWYEYPEPGASPAGTYYIFCNDQLACIGIDCCPNTAESYALIQDGLAAAYGSPAETEPEQIVDMFKAYKEEFHPETLYASVGWTLGDGTNIYFLNINDELFVYYMNEKRLFGGVYT